MLDEPLIPLDICEIATKETTKILNGLSQEHLFNHFSSLCHNGFLTDASVTIIDKMNTLDALKHENLFDQLIMLELLLEFLIFPIGCNRFIIGTTFFGLEL